MTSLYSPWREGVVERLVGLLAPRHILLAGARDEGLCRCLVAAASAHNAMLHVAEKSPPGWLGDLRDEFGARLMVHAAGAAEAVGVLPVPGLAWIDGEPNWFTVHSVLLAVLGQAARLEKPIPVLLVANTGWPHGRRDFYADPSAIPTEFRLTHRHGRLTPGDPVIGAAGLSGEGIHAVTEGGARNGVLTAVEDVVASRPQDMRLAHLPGFGGLAAITPAIAPGADAFAPEHLAADLATLAAVLEAARLDGQAGLRVGNGPAAPMPATSRAASPNPTPATSEEADVARLRASPLFDSEWYLQNNGDVSESGVDPALHYLRHGSAERRDPNPFFSTAYYLDTYPEIARANVNPVLHYLSVGARDGRNPSPAFATRRYDEAYPDVAASGMNPLEHFLKVGMQAGWQAPAVPPVSGKLQSLIGKFRRMPA